MHACVCVCVCVWERGGGEGQGCVCVGGGGGVTKKSLIIKVLIVKAISQKSVYFGF